MSFSHNTMYCNTWNRFCTRCELLILFPNIIRFREDPFHVQRKSLLVLAPPFSFSSSLKVNTNILLHERMIEKLVIWIMRRWWWRWKWVCGFTLARVGFEWKIMLKDLCTYGVQISSSQICYCYVTGIQFNFFIFFGVINLCTVHCDYAIDLQVLNGSSCFIHEWMTLSYYFNLYYLILFIVNK